MTQIITLYGKRFTKRDSVPNLHSSMITVHDVVIKLNADGPFQDMTRSSRPRNTRPREDRSVRQTKSLCKEIRVILRLKGTTIRSSKVSRYLAKILDWSLTGQHESHTWHQWWIKRDWSLLDVVAIGLSLSECNSFYLGTCTLGHCEICSSHKYAPAEPNKLRCQVVSLVVCISFRLTQL